MPVAHWTERYRSKIGTADDAAKAIRPGHRVFFGSGCAAPQQFVAAVARRGPELADTQILHILNHGAAPYADPTLEEQFRHTAFFIGKNVRAAVAEGRADYIPIFLSEIPRLFRSGRVPIDCAFIQVSPPDEHGFCSYGVSVDVVKSAAESARYVAAEINPNMPRTLGDSFIHVDRIDLLLPVDTPVINAHETEVDPVSMRIGEHIAELIDDGATLQMGIGKIPDAVLLCLGDKRDLGIHTEMFAEGVIDLVNNGVINGSKKNVHRGKIVASFVMGTRRMYDFIDNNPMCEFHPTEYTNDPFLIARHDKMVAINSAIQVDLTGQVCADSIGQMFYSGIGGQVDFIRGAGRSQGGRPIIALPSTAKGGTVSRIAPFLDQGAGVVTSRGDVHYVVTEWGVAELHGKSVRERAMALIHIAHPDFRDDLMRAARDRKLVYSDMVAVPAVGQRELDKLATRLVTESGQEVRVRPVRPTDEDMLRDMFYACSEQTVYQRFFAHRRALPHRERRDFIHVDYETDMVLVVVANDGQRDQVVGMGAYGIDAASGAADLSFVVRDDWQRNAIGTHLFQRLIEIARDKGVNRFTADVLSDNHVMLHVFHKCATGTVDSRLEDGIYHLEFTLDAGAKVAADEA